MSLPLSAVAVCVLLAHVGACHRERAHIFACACSSARRSYIKGALLATFDFMCILSRRAHWCRHASRERVD